MAALRSKVGRWVGKSRSAKYYASNPAASYRSECEHPDLKPRTAYNKGCRCKGCKAANRQHVKYHRDSLTREKKKAQAKEHYQKYGSTSAAKAKIRRGIVNRYKEQDGCAHCGYTEHGCALDFHHVDPSTKEFNPGSRMHGSGESIMNEIDKCVVLCKNCHAVAHKEERDGR